MNNNDGFNEDDFFSDNGSKEESYPVDDFFGDTDSQSDWESGNNSDSYYNNGDSSQNSYGEGGFPTDGTLNTGGSSRGSVPNNNEPAPQKKLSNKVVGVIVFVLLIILALSISFFSKLKITVNRTKPTVESTKSGSSSKKETAGSKEKSANSKEVSVDSDEDSDSSSKNSKNSNTESKQSEDNSIESEKSSKLISDEDVDSKVSSKSSSKGEDVSQNDSDNSLNGWTEIDDSSIDYSVSTEKARGTISRKRVYLNDSNQLIYQVLIKVKGFTSPVEFYCTGETFDSVDVNDSINVQYKEVTDSVISVVSITK